MGIIKKLTSNGSSKSPRDTHGPIVKTGPTAGENRSRTQTGQWRRKRSDAGKPRNKTAL